MMPSLEEIERIREAQGEQPDTPLGQAEQFLLSLSEIDCLLERLRLWLFMLDYQVNLNLFLIYFIYLKLFFKFEFLFFQILF